MSEEKQVEIYTMDWCPYCMRAKSMLDSIGLEYEEYDVTDEGEAYDEMKERSNQKTVPQIFINDDHLGGYDDLIEKLTSGELDEMIEIDRPDCTENSWDVAIIGAGPSGMTAAVYAARKGLEVLLVARDIGGQVLETDKIDNYLPEYGTSGLELIQEFLGHVQEYDIDTLFGEEVEDIIHDDEHHKILTRSGKEITTRSIIIATGSKKRKLMVPGEKELTDKGVSYCANCDGFLYKGQTVVVVGGGNSGMEAALDMAQLDSKVYLVEASEKLTGDKHLQNKVEQYEEIEVLTSYQLSAVEGEDKVERVRIENLNSGNEKELEVTAVFIEVGLIPNTGFICDRVEVNDNNEIIIDEENKTSIKGIYAAGDVTNIKDKQIIISAAEGAKAALRISEYLC
ncbi:MAG: glutaredoxin 3 [Halanaerobiales bacterium]